MTVLLKETIKPNLVQTLEGQPAFVHCGPFANIAHGNNSLVADRVALKLGDYVVTESGFGSDMGMEKFFDIVCRVGGLQAERGGARRDGQGAEAPRRRPGRRHRRRREGRGEPDPPPRDRARVRAERRRRRQPLPGRHRRRGRARPEAGARERRVRRRGRTAASSEGGAGGAALAEAVVAAAERADELPTTPTRSTTPIEAKIEAIATRVYGADGISLLPAARERIKEFNEAGLDRLPICMAKTHLSLSARPDARERADRLHGHGARHARVHRRRLDRRALRRHADDARARQDAGRDQRRHRRARDGRSASSDEPARTSRGRVARPRLPQAARTCRSG